MLLGEYCEDDDGDAGEQEKRAGDSGEACSRICLGALRWRGISGFRPGDDNAKARYVPPLGVAQRGPTLLPVGCFIPRSGLCIYSAGRFTFAQMGT
jgi:hypothetical protein